VDLVYAVGEENQVQALLNRIRKLGFHKRGYFLDYKSEY
jgi:hypothetical protein